MANKNQISSAFPGQVGPNAVPKKYDLTSEMGIPGIRHWQGRMAEEFIPQLDGDQGKRTMREMATNDATVGSILFAIEMLIRQASWDVQAGGDEIEQERADFLRSCMHDLDTPWTDFISEAQAALVDGFSLHEIVYKRRKGLKDGALSSDHDDGLIGWAKLAPRSADTIQRWLVDDQLWVYGVVQWAPPDYRWTVIPYDKLLHLRIFGKRSNPEGQSILRRAWRSWLFKKSVEEFEAIGIERDLCGIPMAEIPMELMDQNADASAKHLYNEIKKIVRNIKTDSQGGIVFPMVYDDAGHKLFQLSLISAPGQRTIDTTTVINRYDQRIAMTALADFVLLGHEKVGSFALSSSKTDVFATALGAVMDAIAEAINRQAVPRLMRLNGFEPPYPRITHGDIESADLASLGSYVQALSSSGMQIFPNALVENYLLRAANLPLNAEER
jgi:hypothetical protein